MPSLGLPKNLDGRIDCSAAVGELEHGVNERDGPRNGCELFHRFKSPGQT
jgi:hypothetical protein